MERIKRFPILRMGLGPSDDAARQRGCRNMQLYCITMVLARGVKEFSRWFPVWGFPIDDISDAQTKHLAAEGIFVYSQFFGRGDLLAMVFINGLLDGAFFYLLKCQPRQNRFQCG